MLRASCLAVIMAQLGCYVPCSRAELAPVDRIFTRIGKGGVVRGFYVLMYAGTVPWSSS